MQILENKTHEQLKREFEDREGKSRQISDMARENFKRPAYGKVTHIIHVRRTE